MLFHVSEIYWPDAAPDDLPKKTKVDLDYQIIGDLPSSDDYIEIERLLTDTLEQAFNWRPVTFDWSPDEDGPDNAPTEPEPKTESAAAKLNLAKKRLREALDNLARIRTLESLPYCEARAAGLTGDDIAEHDLRLGNLKIHLESALSELDDLGASSGKEN